MTKTIEQIDSEIKQLQLNMETLRNMYAQPYQSGFRKKYLWTNENAEHIYGRMQDEMGGLLVQKKSLERG